VDYLPGVEYLFARITPDQLDLPDFVVKYDYEVRDIFCFSAPLVVFVLVIFSLAALYGGKQSCCTLGPVSTWIVECLRQVNHLST